MSELKNGKILVTGGAGYVGSKLTLELLRHGYEVRVFDKIYYKERVHASEGIEFFPGDISNFNPRALDGVSGVIHMAAMSSHAAAESDPESCYAVNYEATVKLANACKAWGIKHFTFASGCTVYTPYQKGIIDETAPTSPEDDYGKSKLQAEHGLRKLADDDFSPVILRQGSTFGASPKMRWDLFVNAFVLQSFKHGRLNVLYGGKSWRPVVHVKDVAEAHIRCLEANPAEIGSGVFNVVYDSYTVLEIAERVKRAVSMLGIEAELEINYNGTDKRSFKVKGNKITKLLGFSPSTSIEGGVKEIVEALQKGLLRIE